MGSIILCLVFFPFFDYADWASCFCVSNLVVDLHICNIKLRVQPFTVSEAAKLLLVHDCDSLGLKFSLQYCTEMEAVIQMLGFFRSALKMERGV